MELKEILSEAEGPECEKTAVECICPKCSLRHHMYLYWVGRGVPRKFCSSCRKYSQNSQFDNIFTINLNGLHGPSLANEP